MRRPCFALMALGAFAGCSWYDASLLDATSADGSDATETGDIAEIVPPADVPDVPCVPFHPPPRPSGTDGGADADASSDGSGTTDAGTPQAMVFAVHSFDFHDRPPFDWHTDGFDLDNLCTSYSTPMNQWPCLSMTTGHSTTVIIDGDNGRDDTLNQMFAPLFDSTILPMVNATLDAGTIGMMVWIRGLDSDDDPEVEAGLLLSANGRRAGGGAPTWSGTDVWDYDPSTTVLGDISMGPTIVDAHAYAVGGVIYARLPPRAAILLPSSMATPDGGIGSIAIHMTSAIMTAQIVRDSTTHAVSALDPVGIAGIWALADAEIDLRSAGVCPTMGVGTIVFPNLRASADILVSGMPNATYMCDALSGAAYASTVRAQLGGTVSLPVASDQCR